MRPCTRSISKLRRLREDRTRKIQTLVETISVTAPLISVCPCSNVCGFEDVPSSPLVDLLPERCTPRFRQLQAELSAGHANREAARLVVKFLSGASLNQATMRNRT